jgi:glycosyltransferase involved in cell wall biosynthesis
MRVLFATNQATGLVRGGVFTQMLQTKAALEACGVQVTLYEPWNEIRLSEYDLVHIFTANMATYHFARAIKANGAPMVISPVFFTRRSPRVVRRVIQADALVNRFMRGVWTDYGLIAEMCSWARAVLPNTGDEANIFIQALGVPAERITIIPNGVEERFAHATGDLFVRQYGMERNILYVGQIGAERKNVLRLLEALEQIDRPAAIIGKIEDTPAGRACLERARQNPRLLILDALAHDSLLLASAYAACEVFALPSMFETPGIAALEAALAGAKIVMTPYGGTKDYFAADAVYVDPYSAQSIADGISNALRKPKDPALAERILREFVWSKVGEKTKSVYERVLTC